LKVLIVLFEMTKSRLMTLPFLASIQPKRLKKFKLDTAPEKTSLLGFSRFHPSRQRQFVFLGFEFYWGVDVKGKPRLRRRTASKKQQASLSEFYHFIKAKRSQKLATWLPQLKRKLTGFRNYFGLPVEVTTGVILRRC
jgi:RNA-directed DNA polymerase